MLRSFRVPVLCSIPLLQILACGSGPADDTTQPAQGEGPRAESPEGPASNDPTAPQPVQVQPPASTLELIDTSTLAPCTEGMTEAELEAQLQIAVALHDSVHALVACGGMTITVAATLISGVAGAIIAGTTSFEPDGLRYDGEGRYVAATGAWSEGTLTIRFWMDGPDGPTLIEDNLFDLDAYLRGARISSGFEGTTAWAEIEFDEPGPWVELLGLGANPSSPIRLSGNDLLAFAPELDGIEVSSDIVVDDTALDSVITYSVTSEPMALNDVVAGDTISYELLGIAAENEETGQRAVADADAIDWDIAFGQTALNGSASFQIAGGLFDYELFYGHSDDHSDDIVVSCAE